MSEGRYTLLSSDANLQLYYRFEDNLTDSSSNGRNGTGVNSPAYVTGMFGKAVSLTNAGDKSITTTYTPAYGTGQFSISAWVYATNVSSQQGICATWNGTALQGFALKLSGGTSKFQFQCSASSGNTDTITGNTTVSTGKWYHVVAVRDGSNLNLYVDSVSDATPVASTPRNVSGGVAFRCGASYSTSVGDLAEWDGYIDDLIVLDRALSASEVKLLYQTQSPFFQLIV